MIQLQKDTVLLLHTLLCEKTGGSDGIRDSALLESALSAAYHKHFRRYRIGLMDAG